MKMMYAAGEFVSMETYTDCAGGGESASNRHGWKFFDDKPRFHLHRDAALDLGKRVLEYYENREANGLLVFWCARLRVDIMFLNRIEGSSKIRPFVCEVRLAHRCACNHTTTNHTCLT